MQMKDKLSKNHKGRSYYFFRKIGIFFTIVGASSVVLAIPLSLYLLNHESQTTQATIQQQVEDVEIEKNIIEITYDLKK